MQERRPQGNRKKMTPEEIRRHRRRVERMRRERRRVLRNKIIAGCLLAVIVFFAGSFAVKGLKNNMPKISLPKKQAQTTPTKEAVTDQTESVTNAPVYDEQYSDILDKKITVCIDPGHGGNDQGYVSNDGTVVESKQMLELAQLIKGNLEVYGINVVLTRDSDMFMYLNPRSQVANESNADVFISLKRDEDTSDSEANGIEIYIDKDADSNTEDLAKAVYKYVKKVGALDTSDYKYGSKGDTDTNYVVLDGVEMPGLVISMGYVSNSSDNSKYESNKEKYAKAIAEGILNYELYDRSGDNDNTDETETETEDILGSDDYND